MEKISLIITVLNEERTIQRLLSSIEAQSLKPSEVIIVDGGSTDKTLSLLKAWYKKASFRKIIVLKKGNRSVGRNAAIEQARSKIIAITDAGCELDKNWLKEIVKPFSHSQVDAVAGYYESVAKTPFEKAAAAYMLVMPEHVNEDNFLPATRSMALRKSVWKKVGKFPEKYSYNEDYVFAHALRKQKVNIVFQRSAVVRWFPPTTWNTFLEQVYRFAYGDISAGIFRPKVLFIFIRYIVFALLLLKVPWIGFMVLAAYILWAIHKNYRYAQSKEALWILPIMQCLTDVVVMFSSVLGLMRKIFL